MSIKLPNSVIGIGMDAFGGCKSLASVNIPNSVKIIGGGAFGGCSSLTSINIPNSVTIIASGAFSGCSSLTSVNIPNSVTIIDNLAFSGCTALVKLIALCATPPTCGDNSFYGIDKQKCTLYVPKNSLEAYKAAYGWRDFYNMEEGDPTGISLPSSDGTDKVARRYDTNGHLMPTTFKGLNILKMGDGTTKKVWVK